MILTRGDPSKGRSSLFLIAPSSTRTAAASRGIAVADSPVSQVPSPGQSLLPGGVVHARIDLLATPSGKRTSRIRWTFTRLPIDLRGYLDSIIAPDEIERTASVTRFALEGRAILDRR